MATIRPIFLKLISLLFFYFIFLFYLFIYLFFCEQYFIFWPFRKDINLWHQYNWVSLRHHSYGCIGSLATFMQGEKTPLMQWVAAFSHFVKNHFSSVSCGTACPLILAQQAIITHNPLQPLPCADLSNILIMS